MILVYEYMSNGSLDDHLHKRRNSNSTQLTWVQRLHICIGAARGLDYLHTGTGVRCRVIHRDVKSSNILLDENMEAKVSDFGVSRTCPAYQSGTTTNVYTGQITGTFGYMDAEYFVTRRLTRKSDVYAFGVVLLEVLCGRPALDFTLDEQQHSLAGWAKQCIREGKIDRIIDPFLRVKVEGKCLKEFAQIAHDCVHTSSKRRPTMIKVLSRLEAVLVWTLQSGQSASDQKHIRGAMLIEKARTLFSTKGPRYKYALGKKNNSVRMEDVDELPSFSLYDIANATDNFSVNNNIGHDHFGPIFKGVLKDGREVAVKRLSENSVQGFDEFKNEVICTAKLQHRNLVKLLGYCIHRNEMIMIYEYMANKSLNTFLFDETRSSRLDWPRRIHIIHGMARGILYLHQDSRFQIIHRDLSASNILLDVDMDPKISNFGFARMFVGSDSVSETMKIVGTSSHYLSPEYIIYGKFSIKSDVFSFGVLVLEIVSGKKNSIFSIENNSDNLLGHAWRLYNENRSIELMSESLRDSCVISEVLRSIHVGLLCVQDHAEERPTMLEVVLMLLSNGVLPQPTQPAFSTYAEEERLGEFESVSSGEE